MRPRHLLLALGIVFIWGVNFAIIKLGLRQVSPLALGVARFFLAAFPWVFFIPRPKVPLGMIALYGFLIFALQFGFLFTGMKLGMSAGLSSLILQLQVFFTIGLSVLMLGERPTGWQLAGAVLAFAGVGVVALNVGGDVTVVGLILLVAAAASWGGGNIVSKRISQRSSTSNVLGLVVWGSLFAEEDLDVTTEENQLVVRGRQTDETEREYLHRGIAARQFQRCFVLADGMRVLAAELKNGLLSIDLDRPEAERLVRKINISVKD